MIASIWVVACEIDLTSLLLYFYCRNSIDLVHLMEMVHYFSWNGSIGLYLLHVFKLMQITLKCSNKLKNKMKANGADCFTGNFYVFSCYFSTELPSDHYAKLGHVALALLFQRGFLCTQFSPCIMHMTGFIEKWRKWRIRVPRHKTYPDFLYFSYIIGTSAQTYRSRLGICVCSTYFISCWL